MLKTMKFWLVVSVCFNLLLIGLLFGGVTRAKRMGVGKPPPNEVSAIIRVMPEEKRNAMFEGYRRMGAPLARADIGELADLIDAEPFDAQAVQAYFNRNRAANDERVMQAQSVMMNALSEMDDAERDQMAERLRTMPRHKGGGHKKWDNH